MRTLLLGGGGMLATDLAASAPASADVRGLSHAELDITDITEVTRALDHFRPAWVFNASAYTRVDQAETDYPAALAVNGTAVGRLGELCAARGMRIVHFGTDYVFAGDARRPYRETDAVAPINAYGRSKLAGEEALIASGAKALVLRTQWLYGVAGKSFPRTMWERATNRVATRVVDDQVGRPTSSRDVARATWALVAREASGLYHMTSSGEPATWFDVAAAVFDAVGARELLTACTTSDYPTPARRPAYSVLDTTRLMTDHGVSLPPWRVSLDSFVGMLSAGAARTVG